MTEVGRLVAEISRHDAVIEALADERELFASRLEVAAARWYAETRKTSPRALEGAKSCTSCSFVFREAQLDPWLVLFGTKCSWCDIEGMGLRVPGARLEKYLPE